MATAAMVQTALHSVETIRRRVQAVEELGPLLIGTGQDPLAVHAQLHLFNQLLVDAADPHHAPYTTVLLLQSPMFSYFEQSAKKAGFQSESNTVSLTRTSAQR